MSRTFSRIAVRISGVVVGIVFSSVGLGADSVLTEAVERHSSSAEAIRTLHCKIAIRRTPSSDGGTTAEYWRMGGDFRCRSKSDGVTIEYQRQNGVTTQYVSSAGQLGEAQITDRNMAYTSEAWSFGLMSFYGNDQHRVELKDLLADKLTTATASRAERGGRKMVRIKVSHTRADLEIWLDPAVNHLARHVVLKSKLQDGPPESDTTVESFVENAPGVFFPSKVVCSVAAGKNGQTSRWEANFSEIEVNKPLSPESLRLRLPAGILVSDDLRSGMFRTDASGNPVLPATNAQGKRLTVAGAQPAQLSPSDSELPTRVTEEEPRSPTRWILRVSLVFLASASLLWLIRTVRRRRATGT